MKATIDALQPTAHDAGFEPGDCRAVHLGEVRLDDGRVFQGVVLEFPAGPPKLAISVLWEGTPLTLTVKSTK